MSSDRESFNVTCLDVDYEKEAVVSVAFASFLSKRKQAGGHYDYPPASHRTFLWLLFDLREGIHKVLAITMPLFLLMQILLPASVLIISALKVRLFTLKYPSVKASR